MKNTGVCPKCESEDIYCVPNSLWNAADPRIHTSWMRSGIAITRYLCGLCGYMEEWITSQEALQELAGFLPHLTVSQEHREAGVEESASDHCPACGAAITSEDEVCPSCGISFWPPHEEEQP